MTTINIIERWKKGDKQRDIANDLGVSEQYISQVLAPFKKEKEGDLPEVIMSIPWEIKRLIERVHENLSKAWGFDNKMGREKHRPKYKNLWEDWKTIKNFLDKL